MTLWPGTKKPTRNILQRSSSITVVSGDITARLECIVLKEVKLATNTSRITVSIVLNHDESSSSLGVAYI